MSNYWHRDKIQVWDVNHDHNGFKWFSDIRDGGFFCSSAALPNPFMIEFICPLLSNSFVNASVKTILFSGGW